MQLLATHTAVCLSWLLFLGMLEDIWDSRFEPGHEIGEQEMRELLRIYGSMSTEECKEAAVELLELLDTSLTGTLSREEFSNEEGCMQLLKAFQKVQEPNDVPDANYGRNVNGSSGGGRGVRGESSPGVGGRDQQGGMRRGTVLHNAARRIHRMSSVGLHDEEFADYGGAAGLPSPTRSPTRVGYGHVSPTRRNRLSDTGSPARREQAPALKEVLRLQSDGTHFNHMETGKIHQMHMIFDLCDVDNSGTIGVTEFARILHDTSITGLNDFDEGHMTSSMISRMFNMFDTDESGELDFTEFLQAFDGAVNADGTADTSKVFAQAHHLALANESQDQREKIENMKSAHVRELDAEKLARQEMDSQLERQTDMFEESLQEHERALTEIRRKLDHSEESRAALTEQVEDYAAEIEGLKEENLRLLSRARSLSQDSSGTDGNDRKPASSPGKDERQKREAKELAASKEELERLRQTAANTEEELEAMITALGDVQDENDMLRADNQRLHNTPGFATVDNAHSRPLQDMLTQACNELADAKVEISKLNSTIAALEAAATPSGHANANVIKPPQLADEQEWLRLSGSNAELSSALQAAKGALVQTSAEHADAVALLHKQIVALEGKVADVESEMAALVKTHEAAVGTHALRYQIQTLTVRIAEAEAEKAATAAAARREAGESKKERARLASRIAELQSGSDIQIMASPVRRKSSAEISLASDHSWEQSERQRLERELAQALDELEKMRQAKLDAVRELGDAKGSKTTASAAAERERIEAQETIAALVAEKFGIKQQLLDEAAKLEDRHVEVKELTARITKLQSQISREEDARAVLEKKLQEAHESLSFSIAAVEEVKQQSRSSSRSTTVGGGDAAFSPEDRIKFDRMVAALDEALSSLTEAQEALVKCEADITAIRTEKSWIETRLAEAQANADKHKNTADTYFNDITRMQTELDKASDDISRLSSAIPRSGRIVDGDLHDEMIASRDARINQLVDDVNEARRNLEYSLESVQSSGGNINNPNDGTAFAAERAAENDSGNNLTTDVAALKAERDAATAREKMCQTELDSMRNRRGTSAAAAYEAMQAENERLQERIAELEGMLRELNSEEHIAESTAKDELIQALVGEIATLKSRLQQAVDGRFAALERGYTMASRKEPSTVQNEVIVGSGGRGGGGSRVQVNGVGVGGSRRRFVRRVTHVPAPKESYRSARGTATTTLTANTASSPSSSSSPSSRSRSNFFVRVGTTLSSQQIGLAECNMWVRIADTKVQLVSPEGASFAAWPTSSIVNVQQEGKGKSVRFEVIDGLCNNQGADDAAAAAAAVGQQHPITFGVYVLTGRNREIGSALKDALAYSQSRALTEK